MGECIGECCRKFYLPLSMRELERRMGDFADGVQVAGMVIPLGRDEAGFAYTCVHWDIDTKLCEVHPFRPQMCRDYPPAGCPHDGCDFVTDRGRNRLKLLEET